jgi:hypothetical protein
MSQFALFWICVGGCGGLSWSGLCGLFLRDLHTITLFGSLALPASLIAYHPVTVLGMALLAFLAIFFTFGGPFCFFGLLRGHSSG